MWKGQNYSNGHQFSATIASSAPCKNAFLGQIASHKLN